MAVLDIDDERLWRLFFPNTTPEEASRKTWVVKTRDGFHVYLRLHVTTDKRSRLVQLLSDGCLVVAPPSVVEDHEYRFLSDPRETYITTPDSEIKKVLNDLIDVLTRYEKLIFKMKDLWLEGHRHNLALWLPGALRKANIPKREAEIILKTICLLSDDDELPDRLRALRDTYEKPLHEIKGVKGLVEELSFIEDPSKREEILKLLSLPSEEGEAVKTQRASRLTTGLEADDKLLELVCQGPKPKLLVWDGSSYELREEVEVDGVVYRPPPEPPFAYLPDPPEVIREDPTLWSDTVEFVKSHIDYPKSEDAYHVITSTVAWSYFVWDVKAITPYIAVIGPYGSGKTRLLEIFSVLSYKPLPQVNPSGAVLFRLVEATRPTIIFDEAQGINEEVRELLASGYRYGEKVWRVINPEKSGLEGLSNFNTFGLKIYALRSDPPDDLLQRSIVLRMEKRGRPVAKTVDEETARRLRTRWLAQRLRLWRKISINYGEYRSIFDNPRVEEVASPLVAMARLFGGSEAEAAVRRFVEDYERMLRLKLKASFEVAFLEAIKEIVEERGEDAPEFITYNDLRDKLGEEWTSRRISKIAEELGFERDRRREGRGILIDYELLNRLCRQYGIGVDREITYTLR